jgi:DNA repair protein SbcC/Rad50
MIELVTVEVINFRSFSKAVFEPLGIGQGMTAINGANGMGKSSIVHGLVWALYGITPDGVRVSSLRRQDSEGDVEVKVTLRHDGQTIVITRAIRGKNDTTVASIEVDGVEQTNVSSKTATNWIVSRFGLDAEAFLTAFVVRQKELDSLVRARPAERRKTIERLAGIERMSKALELARGEARLAQKSYDALPPIPSLTILESEKEVLSESTEILVADKDTLTKVVSETKSKLTAIQKDLENAKGASRLATALEGKLDLEESRLEDLLAKYESAEELAKLAIGNEELELEAEKVEASLSEVIDELEEARKQTEQLSRLTEQESRTQVNLDRLTNEKSALEEQRDSLDIVTLSASLKAALERRDSLLVREAELTGAKGAARGEWDRLKKAIDTLSSHESTSDHAKCPTCDSSILDVEILLSSLNASLLSVESEGKKINSDLVETQEEIKTIDAEIKSTQSNISLSESFTEKLDALDSQISGLIDLISETKTLIAENQNSNFNLDEIAERKRSFENRQREILTSLAKMENAISAKNSLPEILSSIETKREQIKTLSGEYEESNKAALSYDVEVLEEEYNSTASDYTDADTAARELNTQIAINKSQLENIENSIAAIAIEEQRRKSLLSEVESKTAAATTLDEFRRDRLARLTPELSEVASDFVSRMTDGKYTSVLLDEDFTPILTDASGAERPVAWLSGGEESAVALALRVAIGEVLAGQRGGLLVLDEALTAQDASRRQATMAAIRALPRQIITINHISEATDMVDLVAEVVAAEEGGSTIQEMVPDNGKVGVVSDAAIDA